MKSIIAIIAPLVLLAAGCTSPEPKYVYNKGFVYGTLYNIVYESPYGTDLQEEINKELYRYTMIFSTYEKESEISKINNNQPVKLSPEFITCFNRAMEISTISDGAFDITAGPMVNAWGFGPEEKKAMTATIVDSLIAITGYHKIKLKNGEIVKDNPGMKLDMSAISKGYTCDLLAGFLASKGCKNYMVEIGGEINAKGINERGKAWTIQISKPDEKAPLGISDAFQAIILLPDHSLATSGNYRNFYIEDGKKYAHTIDPKTGYPVQHSLLSATVLANDCMTADAFATAFMVMGVEAGIKLAATQPEIEIYFVYTNEKGENQVYMTSGFEKNVVE